MPGMTRRFQLGCVAIAIAASLLSVAIPVPAQGAGRAMTFDGQDDLVLIPHKNTLDMPNDFTVEAWIKIPRAQPHPGGQSGIVEKGIDGSRGNANYSLKINNADNKVVLTIGDLTNPSTGWQELTGTQDLGTDFWTHVAGVRSSQSLFLYVNGRLDAQAARTRAQAVNTGPLTIGSLNGSLPSHHLTGSIAQVRIWNYARSAQQIQQSFLTAMPPWTPGLVAYYRFEEAFNDQAVIDSNGGGHHGTLGRTNQVESSDPTRGLSTLVLAPHAVKYGLNIGNNILDLSWFPGSPTYTSGRLVISRAVAYTQGMLGISLGLWNVSAGGYTILIDLSPGHFFPPIPFIFDKAGMATFPLSLKMPLMVGIMVHLQVLELRGKLVFLSNGLRLVFGP